jgi:hypothetical protein
LGEILIKACPICGNEVVNSCYHALHSYGNDFPSKEMTLTHALELAQRNYDEKKEEFEWAEDNLQELKEKNAIVQN